MNKLTTEKGELGFSLNFLLKSLAAKPPNDNGIRAFPRARHTGGLEMRDTGRKSVQGSSH